MIYRIRQISYGTGEIKSYYIIEQFKIDLVKSILHFKRMYKWKAYTILGWQKIVLKFADFESAKNYSKDLKKSEC